MTQEGTPQNVISEPRMKLLILGGYGNFGGRLAELLCEEPALSLIIAGRSQAKAARFCAALAPGARRQAIALDREADLEQQLHELKPDILIDASGPFQAYANNSHSGDPYGVVRAAINAGVHYLDLADGSQFVRGIRQFDDVARQKGLAVLSGVSSFPVLTAAAVRQLEPGMQQINSISGGIAPSPFAGYGLNVIRAIAGYAGKPMPLRRNGRTDVGYPLTEMRSFTVAPPGIIPLRPIEFSLIDVPDLQLLTELWPEVGSVWMGAGPVPGFLHRCLRLLARAVRRGLISSLSPLAPVMYHMVNALRWGEDRGGMFVEIDGANVDGERERRSWHLVAEGKGGPYIPAMAIEVIVRKWLAGLCPMPGARAATQELELEDYRPLFKRREIYMGQRQTAPAGARGLYRSVLGAAFDLLPSSLQAIHSESPQQTASGRASIERGKGWLARLIAGLLAFPKASADVPVTVTFERTPSQEKWTRNFDGQEFSSRLFAGQDRYAGLLCERFGPFVFAMAPVIDGERMSLVMRRWGCLGIPLPLTLAPRGATFEEDRDGRFHFHVEVGFVLIGLVVRYEGYLDPDEKL